ncbi:TIGR00266 family protein [archaeon]|nr:TIGR00266 family protein [archaeon]
MKYNINGTTLQTLDIELNEGEAVYTESGGMSWMSANMTMKTDTRGGLMKGLGRMVSGESLFLTTYCPEQGVGTITFSSEFPGKIVPLELAEGQTMICQKDAFMAAEDAVKLEIHFRKKLGAGFFGGEGFVLQKVTGPGIAFLEIAGEITQYELQEGQILKVDPGHIAFFEPSVNYDITRVKGMKNMLFGGEGIFLAAVKGPGKIWLQSMPLSNLAGKLACHLSGK